MPLRPDFLVLVVFYWSIESPRAGGLALAFIAGLALDVIKGVVLGQHALAFTLMAAWATHLRLRLRVFSVVSQSLTIFALLTGYQFVLFWVDGATGNPVTNFSRWLALRDRRIDLAAACRSTWAACMSDSDAPRM